jgi:predicted component of type VI protein secretion system
MARDIERLLPSNEPRVVVTNVTVTANEDEQQYEIFLQIDVPTLNIYGLTLQNILNSNGYF